MLPVDILMQFLQGGGVGALISAFEKIKPRHEPDGFAHPARQTVAGQQKFVKSIPVDPPGGPDKFMVRIQGIHHPGSEEG